MTESESVASLLPRRRGEGRQKCMGLLYLAVFDLPRHEIGETNRARVGNRETK